MRQSLLLLCLLSLVFPVFAQENAPLNPETLTVAEIIQYPFASGPGTTSSHLSPDGEYVMHVSRLNFCLYTFAGEAQTCADLEEQSGTRTRLDHDTISWSPDGRYLAFTGDALITLVDSDIWVLDVEAGEFKNLTDDGYEGSVLFLEDEDVPEGGIPVDLSPEWRPDGVLSFMRQTMDDGWHYELWFVDPDSGESEMQAVFPMPDDRGAIYQMDWSPDGTKLVFIYDMPNNPFAGIWYYDVADGDVHPLRYDNAKTPVFHRADFSPDGESLLVLTNLRNMFNAHDAAPEYGNGYFVISLDSPENQTIGPEDSLLINAGWLPDGGLIYIANTLETENNGLFVTAGPGADSRKLLDYSDVDGRETRFFAPTPRQRRAIDVPAHGRLLLGTIEPVTLAIQFASE